MVESQVRVNDVTQPALITALDRVARERLCAPARAFAAYGEVEVEIAPGRSLMRARDVAKLINALNVKPGQIALAMAAPYAAAVLKDMGADVTAQEADSRASAVLADALDEAGVPLVTADFTAPALTNVDLLISEAGVAQLPQAWVDAVKVGGQIAVVVRSGPVGKAMLFLKTDAGVSGRELFDATPPTLAAFEPKPVFQL
jgi:protein-L-isoaspartate(D-aspartate) O-methyltransferase